MIKTVYAGYISVHPSDFKYHRNKDSKDWLIINTVSPVEFLMADEWKTYTENQIIILPPETQADYRACMGENYVNHWVSFFSNESYITNTSLPLATPIKVNGQDIFDHLFHMIATENFFDNEYKAQSVNHLFHLLFAKMYENISGFSSSMHNNLSKIRFEIQSNPGFPWTVPYIAEQLNVSTGYLHIIYKKTFGISCMDDILHKRINQAKDYLIHTNYTIGQISELCGYQNMEHFCRQFKKMTSYTASDYRKAHNKRPQL